MSEDRLPKLDGPAATMPGPQLRQALRRLKEACATGSLPAELYLRLVVAVTQEHPPLTVFGRLRDRQ